ncbi:MAG: DUF4382 domain-containing protein, partial [Candidatus Aminicenantia bacterium]
MKSQRERENGEIMKKILISLILVALISGCVQSGILVMKITDAPDDIDSLMVTISQIEVHKAEAIPTEPASCEEQCQALGYGVGTCREGLENETLCLENELDLNDSTFCTPTLNDTVTTCCCDTNTTAPAEQVGWIVFSEEEKTFDLIAIKGVEEILGSKSLDPGKYTQIRLLITSATATINGTNYDVTVSSGKIKLIHPFTIVSNKTTTLLLDFDAEKSLVERGK